MKLINLTKYELDRAQNKYAVNGNVVIYGALVEGLLKVIVDDFSRY